MCLCVNIFGPYDESSKVPIKHGTQTLTGRLCGGEGREGIGEVQVAHVFVATAEAKGSIVAQLRRVGHQATAVAHWGVVTA